MSNKLATQTAKVKKRIFSIFVSVCTAVSKPRNDLDLNQWQKIEYKQSVKEDKSGIQ